MTKSELIAAVADSTGNTKGKVEEIINGTLDAITGELQGGGKVTLTGFGNFEGKKRAARQGRNPKTGEVITIPAKTAPTFKPGKALKDAVA